MTSRQIVLDTETTGLDPAQGHRIIEIGCVELSNRRLTGQRFHRYLRPDRPLDPEAVKVHGLSAAFLADKPRFAEIAEEWLAFIRGAELIIHNAPFDVGFLEHELCLAGHGGLRLADICRILDTLQLARQRHPGQKNSLDALCRRYAIDNSQRTLHGALLDAEILADVYLAMTRQQVTLGLATVAAAGPERTAWRGPERRPRPPLRIQRATAVEQEAHQRYLTRLEAGGQCLWRRLDSPVATTITPDSTPDTIARTDPPLPPPK